jgi:hypothetical protein
MRVENDGLASAKMMARSDVATMTPLLNKFFIPKTEVRKSIVWLQVIW